MATPISEPDCPGTSPGSTVPGGAGAPGRLRRVLYVIGLDPTRKLGSMEEQILFLARAFRKRGGLLLPLFSTSSPADKAIGYAESGLPVACLDLARFRRSISSELVRLIDRNDLEVAHWGMCSPVWNSYLWALSILRPRVQHFFTDHSSRLLPFRGAGSLPARLVKRTLLRRYSRVIGVSQFVTEQIRQQNVWPAPTCCLHFINTERFSPDSAAAEKVRGERKVGDKFVAMIVANLIREKGIHVMIDALPLLPPTVVVWVAGEGPEADRLRVQAAARGVQDRIVFLGPQIHVEPFLQAADCLVCPSIWAEAAGLVNIEAQACGLPVVGSSIGGIPEYVLDERTGLLFRVGDAGHLAEQLRRLHDDRPLCRALGARAREWAVAQFSPEARLESYLDLYRETPEGRGFHQP